jgi:SAM-dependent methyltransferase
LDTNPRGVSYDQVPYVSMPFKSSHPRTMAVIAALNGVTTAPLGNCRVLEIGCAGGGHLLPIAAIYPRSQFVGVDRSTVQLEQARELAQAAELRNVQLHCRDLCEFDPPGEFDYIIAHGFYSWVPAQVRDRLLHLCGKHLSPRGVAFVSYMVNPGAYVNCALRHMMQLTIRNVPDDQLAAAARKTANLLVEIAPKLAPRWGPVLAKWGADVCKYPDFSLLHDTLEATYHAVYLTEFVEHAAANGLKYLADASADQWASSSEIQNKVAQISPDPLLQVQAMDIAGFRMFRQSLLGRPDAEYARPDPLAMIEKWFFASDKLLPPVLKDQPPPQQIAPPGSLQRAILSVLAKRWPKTISFGELSRQILLPAGVGTDRPVAQAILKLYERNRLEIWPREPAFIDDGLDPTRARTTKLAQVQSARGLAITNLRHMAFEGKNDVARKLVASLNGTPPSEEALKYIPALVRNSMLVNQDGLE